MITTTKIYTKPSPATLWHWEVVDKTTFAGRRNEYISSGKLLSENKVVDGLTATFTKIWKDQASLDEYNSDPISIAYWTERDNYNKSVGITQAPIQISNQ